MRLTLKGDVDLGRLWQPLLLGGLFLRLFLMGRALWPAFRRPREHRSLLVLFLISSLAIAFFTAPGWASGSTRTWRWRNTGAGGSSTCGSRASSRSSPQWVVAFPFSRLQLIRAGTATTAALFSTCVFLSGGIIGIFHHLYFAGTLAVVMALGALFSALEVVPLVLIGFEAWENLRSAKVREWVGGDRWAI